MVFEHLLPILTGVVTFLCGDSQFIACKAVRAAGPFEMEYLQEGEYLPTEPGVQVVPSCGGTPATACLRALDGAGRQCALTSAAACVPDPCGGFAAAACPAGQVVPGAAGAVACRVRGGMCVRDAGARACRRREVWRGGNPVDGPDSLTLTRVCKEDDVLQFMATAAAESRSVRVVGNAWSWARALVVPRGAGAMLQLGGALRNDGFHVDAGRRLLVAPGGMRVHDIYTVLQVHRLDWYPKGHCFYRNDSQTIAGIVANNVHHTFTPTTYEHVEALDIATFVDGRPAVVHASRGERPELFNNAFGGAGLSGIIVRAYLRLSEPAYYDIHHKQVDVSPLDLAAKGVPRVFADVVLDGAARRVERMEPMMLWGAELALPNMRFLFKTPVRRARPPARVVRYEGKVTGAKYMDSHNATLPRVVRGADGYVAASRDLGERNAVTTGDGKMGEYSLGVPVRHTHAFTGCMKDHMPLIDDVQPAVPRFLPKSGGGFMTSNAEEDVLHWDMLVKSPGPKPELHAAMVQVMHCTQRAIYPQRLRVWSHTGKSQFVVPREYWGVDTARLNNLLDVYDPQRVFSREVAAKGSLYFAAGLKVPAPKDVALTLNGARVRAASGSITDGYAVYPVKRDLSVTVVGRNCRVTWRTFDLEGSARCRYDHVVVSTPTGSTRRYCGTALPPSILMDGDDEFTVTLHSDDAVVGAGFDADFVCEV